MGGLRHNGIGFVFGKLNMRHVEALSVCEPNMLVGVRCGKSYGCRVADGETAVVDNVSAVVVIICKIGLRNNGVLCVVAETGGAVCFKISCGLNLFCISRAFNSLTQLIDGFAV